MYMFQILLFHLGGHPVLVYVSLSGIHPILFLTILFFSTYYVYFIKFDLAHSSMDSKNKKGRERLTFPRLNGFVGFRAANIFPELAKVNLLAG